MNPVVSQPRYGAGGTMASDWQTGGCDCCSDIGICLCGTFFPLCLSCQIASDMDECCLCGASVAMRTMYRTRYGIPTGPCTSAGWVVVFHKALSKNECVVDPLKDGAFASLGSICNDFLWLMCFPQCALCQLKRDIEKRKAMNAF